MDISEIDPALVALRKRFSAKNDAELARMLGLSHAAVSSWKRRGVIPLRYLIAAGISLHGGMSGPTLAPAREGFFWGRWHTPAPGTADDGEMCRGTEWEVHNVFRAGAGGPGDELRAFVPGVEKSQPIDAFEWGNEVVR